MSVTVIIPVFGDYDRYLLLAERAERSAWNQTVQPDAVIVSVDTTLQLARNVPAGAATTEFLLFLDADDELDQNYIEKILQGEGDLRQPSTLGIVEGKEDPSPVLLPKKNLLTEGNYLIIGTLIRRELFEEVGGFRDLPAYEDWDLFIRCYLAGACITAHPEAIYRVHVQAASRNQLTQEQAIPIFMEISSRYLGQERKVRT